MKFSPLPTVSQKAATGLKNITSSAVFVGLYTSSTYNRVVWHKAKRWLVIIYWQKNPVNGIFKKGNRKIGESVLHSDFSLVTVPPLFFPSRARDLHFVSSSKSGTCVETL